MQAFKMPLKAVPAFQGGVWQQLVLPALVQDYSSKATNSSSIVSSSNIDQEAVCKLLCCSKAISSDLHAECSGQLSAVFCARSLQQSQWFAAWLARNAHLLQQLQLSFSKQWQNGRMAVGGAFSAGVPVAIAGALNVAAVRDSLQHLRAWVDHLSLSKLVLLPTDFMEDDVLG
jgi:hypothetical protein